MPGDPRVTLVVLTFNRRDEVVRWQLPRFVRGQLPRFVHARLHEAAARAISAPPGQDPARHLIGTLRGVGQALAGRRIVPPAVHRAPADGVHAGGALRRPIAREPPP